MSLPGGFKSGGMKSMRAKHRDESKLNAELSPGIWRRVLKFAAPYKWKLLLFVILIAIDAGVGALNPLIYAGIIDQGIKKNDTQLVAQLAVLLGVLAVFDAGLMLVERWISSRISQGLVYDMRTQVFAHFQKMPIAFFSRTQTGALISRLNSDVSDAQGAFTN